MSGALNSVLGGGNILGAALNIASMVYPPLAIATSVANLVQQSLGPAINQGLQQLTQNAGMPKFLGQEVGDLVNKVISDMLKPSNPGCDEEVQKCCGNEVKDFAQDFMKDFVNGAAEKMGGEKKKGSGSWLEALAQALGEALDKQAAKIEELSGQITNENAKDKPSTMTELQTASQRMSFMMSAADQVLKTLGEALSTMARKQ